MKRRDFMRLSGAAGGGLLLQVWLPAGGKAIPQSFQPNLLVRIDPDSTVTFTLTKLDFGQGVATGFPMIFADELGADLSTMKIVNASYDTNIGHTLQGITGGSNSTSSCWFPLREAAARTREMLILTAAKRWGVDISGCKAELGKVINQASGKEIPFGALAEEASKMKPPSEVTLKQPSEFRYIGRPIGNLRAKNIVSGKEKYSIDIVREGMLYASIERCPVHLGKVRSYDDTEARRMPGIIDVIKIDQVVRNVSVGVPGWDFAYPYTVEEGIAVVGTSTWAAMQGRKALHIQWDEGRNATATVDGLRAKVLSIPESDLVIEHLNGRAGEIIGASQDRTEASYEIPFLAHCVMEPQSAIADVRQDRCELWCGTQFPKRFVEEVSAVLGLREEHIACHVVPCGGGFGRNWEPDFIVEAALISRAIQKPVKLNWTREDEIQHDYFHSFQTDKHTAVLDASHNLLAWNIDQYSCFKFPKSPPWNPYSYALQNYRCRKIDFDAAVETGPWRSVEDHKDALSIESFIDELAHKAGIDPLEWRLKLLSEPIPSVSDSERLHRLETDRQKTKRVLALAAEKVGWKDKRNLGIAVARFGSHCAQVAEIDIVKGRLVVKKVTLAIDCGTVVNPSFAENQLVGAVIFALQAVLYGGIDIRNGRVEQSNFHNYKMIRINEVPKVDVHFVKSDAPPTGIGEPGVPPLAPAVLNAIFAVTGKRVRKIPVLKEDLA